MADAFSGRRYSSFHRPFRLQLSPSAAEDFEGRASYGGVSMWMRKGYRVICSSGKMVVTTAGRIGFCSITLIASLSAGTPLSSLSFACFPHSLVVLLSLFKKEVTL